MGIRSHPVVVKPWRRQQFYTPERPDRHCGEHHRDGRPASRGSGFRLNSLVNADLLRSKDSVRCGGRNRPYSLCHGRLRPVLARRLEPRAR